MTTVTIDKQKPGTVISQDTIHAIVHAIAEEFSPERIILFGSYATDHPTPDSDLDLLIIMNTQLPRHKRAAPIRLLFRPAPCAMDILVYTADEAAYWDGVANHIVTEASQTGKVVYARPQH